MCHWRHRPVSPEGCPAPESPKRIQDLCKSNTGGSCWWEPPKDGEGERRPPRFEHPKVGEATGA
eukprot:1565208-Alexandrium_andersonii.AAC.1